MNRMQKVKELFKDKKICIHDIAQGLCVSRQAVHQVLNRNISKCEIGTVQRVARILGLSLELRIK